MKKPVTVYLLMVLAFASGCASFTVNSDYDMSQDFSRLRTYNWVPGPQPRTNDPRIDNSLLDTRIRTAVDEALQLRGYTKTSGTPDFWVQYQAAIQGKLDVTTMPAPYSAAGPYMVGPGGVVSSNHDWYSYTHQETIVTQYDEGTVLIDVVNPETKKLMWRGSVSGVVDPEASPEKRTKRIREAVGKTLAQFPPLK